MPSLSCRTIIVLAALVLPAMPAAAADGIDRGNLVGRMMPPYPAGLDELQGSCIPGGPDRTQICDHSIAVLGHRPSDPTRQPVSRWIVSTRNLDRDARQPRWFVTDAVAAPKPRAGYELQIASCRIDRTEAPTVIAFVRHREGEFSRDVRWAWQYDLAAGKLVPVDAKRVDCVNEGAGL